MKWYETPQVSGLWAILRIWLGVQWLQAGWGKAFGEFDASGFIQGAIAKSKGEEAVVQAWYGAFLESFALPNSGLFNFLVSWGEVLVGIGLIVGLLTVPALVAGATMNIAYLLAGTVSTNVNLLVVAFILLLVRGGAYYWGGDRFAMPYIKERLGFAKKDVAQSKV